MRLISLSKILGRQGMIKNYHSLKIKNYLREDDKFTGSCVTTNDDRYYNLDERLTSVLIYKKRYTFLKV